jgi:hypothetical protein
MKKLLFTLSVLSLFAITAKAQAPAFFNYQGVARNATGNALVNKTIRLRLSIHDGGAIGTVVYAETRLVTTNAFGLFNVQVGGAGALSITGTIAGTNWNSGTKWMQVEMDPEGGTNLKDIGTTQLTSVPYSLFTTQSGDIVLPFTKTQNEEAPLFKIINSGNNSNSLSYEGITNSTANNAAAMRGIVASPAPGIFSAGIVGQNNSTGANGVGVYGTQNGSGYGVYGTTPGGTGVYGNSTSGTGVYGQSVSGPSVMGFQPTTGSSNAGYFQNTSVSNSAAVLRVQTNGSGDAVNLNMAGIGKGQVIALVNAANSNPALEVSTAGTGFAATFTNTNATSKALRTSGAVQLTGIGEGLNRILMTDVSGNANWNTLASIGGVSGTGTLNFVPKWTPNGTFIGNSQIADDGTTITVGGLTNFSRVVKILDPTQSATTATGALVVSGGAGIEKNIYVGGNAVVTGSVSAKSVAVTDNTSGYVATFTNTNTGNGAAAGDGIKIQLGKEKPLDLGGFNLPTYGTFLPGITGALSNSIFTNGAFNTNITAGTFYQNMINGATNDVFGYASMISAGLCKLSNLVIDQINSGLGLDPNGLKVGPYSTPNIHILDRTVLFGGLDLGALGSIPTLAIPALDVPATQVVPQFTLIPKIPNIPNCPDFTNPFNWNLTFPTASSTPLTKNNEFIGFFDNNGAKVGAIRGQSLQDFIEMYTDIPHLVSAAAVFVNAFDVDFGTPDPFSAVKIGSKALDYFVGTWDKVGKIGVEYSSGNGDYAEWLERMDAGEIIGTGDIVAVKGGKITKNIAGAEQIMAVSYHPIVLGNMPAEKKISMGNNIAFMGQIPVKVMGPVKAGDYIVAKSEIEGYGIAVSPENMKVEDYKLAVGRSWATNEKNGPKMVNTVVGVHNNGFLTIIKELQQRADTNDARLKAIEEKLSIPAAKDTKTQKKAFK